MTSSKQESGSSSEKIFTTNLKLLGFHCEDKSVVVSLDMFEHSNQKYFQQVLYFLLNCLDREKGRTEFRDCWPPLDKKQEADFRKRVSNWIKDLQRDNPSDLAHVNPALFQSPGGRKFVQFLRMFTTFVLKRRLEKDGMSLLPKPGSKNKAIRKMMFRHRVELTAANLRESVANQKRIGEYVVCSKANAEILTRQYFNLKSRKETASSKLEQTKQKITTAYPGSDESTYSQHEEYYLALSDKFQKKIDCLQESLLECESVAEKVIQHQDANKPILDFSQYPRELVNKDDLVLTYEKLLRLGGSVHQRCKDMPMVRHWSSFPKQAIDTHLSNVELQVTSLRKLKPVLDQLKQELNQSVDDLSRQADQVDWIKCFGYLKALQREETQVLLPPTPAMERHAVQAVQNSAPELVSQLNLATPSDKTRSDEQTTNNQQKQLAGNGEELSERLIDTPTGATITRRINRKITPDQSPLLRVSLLQSALRRHSNHTDEFSTDLQSMQAFESKASLDNFSPVLSSTMRPDRSPVRLSKEEPLHINQVEHLMPADPDLKEEEETKRTSIVMIGTPDSKADKESIETPHPPSSQSLAPLFATQNKINSYKQVLKQFATADDPKRVESVGPQRGVESVGLIEALETDLKKQPSPMRVSEVQSSPAGLNVTAQPATTQSKIEIYKRVLQTVNQRTAQFRKPQQPSDDEPTQVAVRQPQQEQVADGQAMATDLLGVWTQVRQKLSPKTSPIERSKSRLGGGISNLVATPFTPFAARRPDLISPILGSSPNLKINRDCSKEDSTTVATRLEALMDSLTLNDDSLDDLTRLSFGDELLLSPHY